MTADSMFLVKEKVCITLLMLISYSVEMVTCSYSCQEVGK